MKQLKVVEIADELTIIREKIATIKADKIAPLDEQEKELTAILIDKLKRQGLKTIKTDSGLLFTRAQRSTIKVTDEVLAYNWAHDNNALRINTTKCGQILRREMDLPNGFEESVTEYLSVRKIQDDE